MDGATIDPASPRTNDSLTVVAGSTDVDGDTVTYDYQWKKNGADLAGETGDELDLSVLGNGDKGDEIAVALTPSDGTDQGPAFTTDPGDDREHGAHGDGVAVRRPAPAPTPR